MAGIKNISIDGKALKMKNTAKVRGARKLRY